LLVYRLVVISCGRARTSLEPMISGRLGRDLRAGVVGAESRPATWGVMVPVWISHTAEVLPLNPLAGQLPLDAGPS